MKMNVNPTRMELLKLRRRHSLAKRGYKLLKDKEEQLLIEFRKIVDTVREQRKKTEEEINKFYMEMLQQRNLQDEKKWQSLLTNPFFKTLFYSKKKSIFNIPLEILELKTEPEKIPPDYMNSPHYYYLTNKGLEIIKKLFQLANLEDKLISFSKEIERTRRRVNALEFVLIPNIEETIKFIDFKLQENERANLVKLKHIQLTREDSSVQ
jgi:V/A-type H+/Na+-transporting ATPase subunit D